MDCLRSIRGRGAAWYWQLLCTGSRPAGSQPSRFAIYIQVAETDFILNLNYVLYYSRTCYSCSLLDLQLFSQRKKGVQSGRIIESLRARVVFKMLVPSTLEVLTICIQCFFIHAIVPVFVLVNFLKCFFACMVYSNAVWLQTYCRTWNTIIVLQACDPLQPNVHHLCYVFCVCLGAPVGTYTAGISTSSLGSISESCGTFQGHVPMGRAGALECNPNDLPFGRLVCLFSPSVSCIHVTRYDVMS